MSISFIGSSWATQRDGVAPVARPSGVLPGDLLLAWVGGDIRGAGPATLSGWTNVAVPQSIFGLQWANTSLGVWMRRLPASLTGEPTSYPFVPNGGDGSSGVLVMAYRGADGVDVAAGGSTNTQMTAPSVTPSSNHTNDLLVCGWFGWGAVGSSTPIVVTAPGGFTVRAQTSLTYGHGYGNAYSVGDKPAGTTATGDQVATLTGVNADPRNQFGAEAASVLLYVWGAPNAPTLNLPSNNSSIARASVNRFTWTPSLPIGDTQSQFDLRFSYNNGSTWSTITGVTTNAWVDMAGGSLPLGTMQWQVRTYGSTGTLGPYSSSSFVTIGNPPAGPTITDPTNGATLGSATHNVAFSFPSLTAFRYRVLGSTIGGAADPTKVIVPLTEIDIPGQRSFTISGLTNGATVHILLAVQAGGLWSTETESVNLVSYTPPAVPAVSLAENNANASIVVAWATAAGVGETPSATTAEVWISTDGGLTSGRYAKAQAPSGSWTFWTPASGVVYSFRVVAFADNGTWAASPWGDVTGGFFGTGVFGTGVFGEAD